MILGYDRKTFTIFVLTVLLAASLSFIGYSYYIGKRAYEIQQASITAYQRGIIDTTSSIFLQSERCQTTTVVSEGKTRTFVDVDCLQKPN